MIFAQTVEVGNSLNEWTSDQGVAVVLLFLIVISLGLAGWKILNWTGSNIIVPMKDAMIAHLSTTDRTMNAMQQSLESMHEELRQDKNLHEKTHAKQDALHAQQTDIAQKIVDIGRRDFKANPPA